MKLSGIFNDVIKEQTYLDLENNIDNYDYTEGGNEIKVLPWMRGQIGSLYMNITINGNKIQFMVTPKDEEYIFEALKIEGPETNDFKPSEDPAHLIQRCKDHMIDKMKEIFDMINHVGVNITTDPDNTSITQLEISND